jgi:hypothetical protein
MISPEVTTLSSWFFTMVSQNKFHKKTTVPSSEVTPLSSWFITMVLLLLQIFIL